jgi:hypothetical protein
LDEEKQNQKSKGKNQKSKIRTLAARLVAGV